MRLIYLLLFLMVSCGPDPFENSRRNGTTNQTNNAPVNLSECGCTNENSPVCGVNGVSYLNSCFATCANVSYFQGVCATTNSQQCSMNSGQVCGQPPMPSCPSDYCTQQMPAPVLYSSECEMVRAQATRLDLSSCNN